MTGHDPDPRVRRGVLYGLGAYGIWGLVPLFWPLVKRAGALEILANRIVWSLLVAVILSFVFLPRGWFGRLASRRSLLLLGLAAAAISVNWGVYIWGVNNGHVVETALGYYINPLLSILVGVIFLGERMPVMQWVAVGIAAVAVVVLTIDYGHPPWIALALAVSFASYGVLKKQINAGAIETLTVESAFLVLPALAYLIHLQLVGRLTFGHLGWAHSLLLVSGGLVTVVPLLFFAAAATRVPLSTIGLLQYMTPTFQFLLGVLLFHESMSTGRWVGFGLVWVALAVLTASVFARANANRKARDVVPEPV
ncbi:EamA family transporter RarD [Microlunatus panaciterrae]|uniref:Chloramphenicol-sensitive protein RarD n=1 Tax=Microlunatus panaciterrae TaxID=400768 RepID=A0ABS2RKF3_9ACTN|nr:EamA family transporter RarD [Microlunatus panaciterrae]MBM7799490.1 chloramphenicol-sensitive protein RarD [Microlunatus panaciterrae]